MTQTLKLTFRDLDKQVCSLNWARRLCERTEIQIRMTKIENMLEKLNERKKNRKS